MAGNVLTSKSRVASGIHFHRTIKKQDIAVKNSLLNHDSDVLQYNDQIYALNPNEGL